MSIADDKQQLAYHEKSQRFWDSLHRAARRNKDDYNTRQAQNPRAHLSLSELSGTAFEMGRLHDGGYSIQVLRISEPDVHIIRVQNSDGNMTNTWTLKRNSGGEVEAYDETMTAFGPDDIAELIVNRLKKEKP